MQKSSSCATVSSARCDAQDTRTYNLSSPPGGVLNQHNPTSIPSTSRRTFNVLHLEVYHTLLVTVTRYQCITISLFLLHQFMYIGHMSKSTRVRSIISLLEGTVEVRLLS